MKNNIFEISSYNVNESCIFRKTKEEFGGLSNMASGYPLIINSTSILTSEALYQACRFPHIAALQERILNEKSPMAAKMITKPYRSNSRPDWQEVRVEIMRWCLHLKLAQNFVEFGQLLLSTGNFSIVEESHKDNFWGTIRGNTNPKILIGQNILGKLIAELREFYLSICLIDKNIVINPPNIENFNLVDKRIQSFEFNPTEEIKNKISATPSSYQLGIQGSFDFS